VEIAWRIMGTMSVDVITGSDGKPRCAWVGASDTAAMRYHDEVWGTRTYDQSALFEALTLERDVDRSSRSPTS
jgi:Methyladenine glycosylase